MLGRVVACMGWACCVRDAGCALSSADLPIVYTLPSLSITATQQLSTSRLTIASTNSAVCGSTRGTSGWHDMDIAYMLYNSCTAHLWQHAEKITPSHPLYCPC